MMVIVVMQLMQVVTVGQNARPANHAVPVGRELVVMISTNTIPRITKVMVSTTGVVAAAAVVTSVAMV